MATKVRLLSETPGRPAIGVRFATKLPNASNENGIGLDTTDFYATLLIGKTVQSVRLVGNAGLGILGDPTRGDRQGDVLQYGFSVARAVRQGVEIVGEINGRLQPQEDETAPPGTDTRAAMRVGGRFTHRTVRFDGGIILGMTSRDPELRLHRRADLGVPRIHVFPEKAEGRIFPSPLSDVQPCTSSKATRSATTSFSSTSARSRRWPTSPRSLAPSASGTAASAPTVC